MKKLKKIVASVTAVALAISTLGWLGTGHATAKTNDYAPSVRTAEQNNPVVTNGYTADPYAIEYNGRVYVYMTNDNEEYEATNGENHNAYSHIKSIRIISSDDMVNWTDHGVVELAGAYGICEWAGVSWAPAITYKKINGKDKFFLYFTDGGNQIGVVTSDSPVGPFKDELGKALVGPSNSGTDKALDPAVLVDDDGTGYLTYGAGDYTHDKVYPGTARVVKLGADMVSLAGTPVKIDAPYMFEDSGISKIGNKYYFSYCTSWEPRNDQFKTLGAASIAYMMADSPTGPYTFTGEVLPNAGEVFEDAANNHHCFINFKGKYYMFYHTLVLDRKSKPKVMGYRSCQIDEMTVNPDGTLNIIKQDLTGVSQVKSFDPYRETAGSTFSDGAGINMLHGNNAYTEAVASNSYKYSWTYIKGADFGKTSPKSITVKMRLAKDCNFKISADSVDGPEIANTTVKASSDGIYTVSIPVNQITGVHNIYFEFSGNMKEFISWQFKNTAITKPSVTKTAAPADVTVGKVEKVKAKVTSSTEAVVSWKEIKGAEYKIVYGTSKSFVDQIKDGDVRPRFQVYFVKSGTNNVTLNKLRAGSSYFIKVCAYKKSGNNLVYGKWSSTVSIKIK